MIAVVDYKMGNIASVVKAFRRLGVSVDVVTDSTKARLKLAEKIILPGVGNFSAGVKRIRPFRDLLNRRVLVDKVPVLGICLGMEIFGRRSDEGSGDGLGWIGGDCVRLETSLKVPHVGWNTVSFEKDSPISFRGVYYFDHSYHLVCNKNDVLMTTTYGCRFVSVVGRGNIFGVQFHPEKSHWDGLELLKGFLDV